LLRSAGGAKQRRDDHERDHDTSDHVTPSPGAHAP